MKPLVILLLLLVPACKTVETLQDAGTVGAFAAVGSTVGPVGAMVGGSLGTLVVSNVDKTETIEALEEDKNDLIKDLMPDVITETIELPATFRDFMRKFWYILLITSAIGLALNPKKGISFIINVKNSLMKALTQKTK